MEYKEAGKFIKKKRKSAGFKTQKSYIKAIKESAPELNCSESYISLIESGAKSPSVKLLDVMAKLMELSQQEKGELLLIYKRVPNDLEFAVRSNLKESLKETNIDLLKKKYKEDKIKKNFDNLIRALVLDGHQDEALVLLKTAPEFSSNFIDYQDRTAQMAGLSGNYDFAIQAFQLALDSCPDEYIQTKADFYKSIGIMYFAKAMKLQNENAVESLELLILSSDSLKKSLNLNEGDIYCLDEFARCSYHIGEALQFFVKNKQDIVLESKNENLTKLFTIMIKDNIISSNDSQLIEAAKNNFQNALKTYEQILSHADKANLPEKALKEAVYFYAYSFCKLGLFDQALILINSIIILDQNWLTYFLKTGYFVLRYEKENKEELLDGAIQSLSIAMDYSPETVKDIISSEKERELKVLWKKREKALNVLLKEDKNAK